MGKKKGKPMSVALKRFLKKYGRFPKKGELKRKRKSCGDHRRKSPTLKKHKKSKAKRSSRGSSSSPRRSSQGRLFAW